MNCLKRNLNVKNININIKRLRKTNRPLIEKTLPPGNQTKQQQQQQQQ